MGFLYASTSTKSSNNSMTTVTGGIVGSRDEIVEERPVGVIEDKIYVLVGKEVKESLLTLRWAFRNSARTTICILHVHKPAKMIPIMGAEFPISYANKREIRTFRGIERRNMEQLLDRYILICEGAGVRAEKQHITRDSIEDGIMELISQHGIRKLIMGAAADRLYSKKMTEPKSKKARYVRLHAPLSCHIWFICRGNLIYEREGRLDRLDLEAASQSVRASPNHGSGELSSLRSRSVIESRNNELKFTSSAPGYRRVRSNNGGMGTSAFSCPDGIGVVTSRSCRLNAEGSSDELDGRTIPKAQESETSRPEELRQRKENEEELSRVREELRVALEQKSRLQSQISNSAEAASNSHPSVPLLVFIILVIFTFYLFK